LSLKVSLFLKLVLGWTVVFLILNAVIPIDIGRKSLLAALTAGLILLSSYLLALEEW
jgi:hypothetical protein